MCSFCCFVFIRYMVYLGLKFKYRTFSDLVYMSRFRDLIALNDKSLMWKTSYCSICKG